VVFPILIPPVATVAQNMFEIQEIVFFRLSIVVYYWNPGCPINGKWWSEKQSISIDKISYCNWYRLVLVNPWSIDSHTKAIHRLMLIGKKRVIPRLLNSKDRSCYRAFSHDVIKFLNPNLKSHQSFYPYQA